MEQWDEFVQRNSHCAGHGTLGRVRAKEQSLCGTWNSGTSSCKGTITVRDMEQWDEFVQRNNHCTGHGTVRRVRANIVAVEQK
jgi:hypothetical protein